MKTVSNSSVPPRRSILALSIVLAVGVALYITWGAWRAQKNLVTLDVRDMEVRLVVNKIAAQTWEEIFVHKDVQGKVTLKVVRMPLEQVLRMVGDQTFSRSAVLYPLYSTRASLVALRNSLRGDVDPATAGWTNLQTRALMGGLGAGMGRGIPGSGSEARANRLVSLNLHAKEVNFATLAFSRFAQARVVPEDGTTATISLMLKESTVPKAVAQFAKAADRKWATVYALQSGPGGPGGFARFSDSGPGGSPRDGFRGPEMTDEQREAARQQRETLEAELRDALPLHERLKMDQAQAARERQMQEMASMTDEQRRNAMTQMAGAAMSQMARDRVMNSTPEQRAQMGQRMNQRQGGGPGGLGGGRRNQP